MISIVAFLVVVGLVVLVVRAQVEAPSGDDSRSQGRSTDVSYVLRDGTSVQADEAFQAWTSGDLKRMLSALKVKTNPIDRHFLLMGIVKACYKNRKAPEARARCREISELHLSEFPSIAPALKRDMGGTLPRVSTFQHYATVLTEDGDFDRALEVCELALEYGLKDATKSGFEGRIQRIERKRDRSAG